MKRILQTFMSAVVMALPLLTVQVASAATAPSANVALSPATGNAAQESTLSVGVYEDSGSEPVNAAKIDLTYEATQLDFVTIDSSSAFGVVAQSSGANGAVQIERSALPAVSGRQLVATVRFKVKAASGTSTVAVSKDSSIVSANSNKNILTSSTNATYGLTAATSNPSTDKIAPKISNQKASNITGTTATITWETSEPATSEVNYGVSKSYGLTAGDTSLGTAHSVTLSSSLLRPSTTYHFMVKSVDAAGNAVSGPDSTFTTKGLSVNAIVTDQNKQVVSGATVKIQNSSAKTDSNGTATVTDLKAGPAVATVSYKGNESTKNITIKAADVSGKSQVIQLTVDSSGGSTTFPLLIIIVVVVLILVGYYWFRRRKNAPKTTAGPVAPSATNTDKSSTDKAPADIDDVAAGTEDGTVGGASETDTVSDEQPIDESSTESGVKPEEESDFIVQGLDESSSKPDVSTEEKPSTKKKTVIKPKFD